MMSQHDPESCRRLLDSLEALTDSDEVERILAEHLDTCPVCAGEEHRLGDLMARFAQSDLGLPPGLEARLLDRLCPPN